MASVAGEERGSPQNVEDSWHPPPCLWPGTAGARHEPAWCGILCTRGPVTGSGPSGACKENGDVIVVRKREESPLGGLCWGHKVEGAKDSGVPSPERAIS